MKSIQNKPGEVAGEPGRGSLLHKITLSPRQLSKLRNGHPVQVKYADLEGGPVEIPEIADSKKIMRAIKNKKGVRITLSPAEVQLYSESLKTGGKINIGKAFKKLGKEASKGLKDFGEDLKKVPKYYRNNIREYTSPIAKELLVNVVPDLVSKGVEEGLKSQGAPPAVAKATGSLVKVGLKKPMTMGYKKSGLGLKQDVIQEVKKGIRKAKSLVGGSFRPA